MLKKRLDNVLSKNTHYTYYVKSSKVGGIFSIQIIDALQKSHTQSELLVCFLPHIEHNIFITI